MGEQEPNFDEDNAVWLTRPDVEQRIQEKLERYIPDQAIRRDTLAFLAFAIENAHEENENSWYLKETRRGLRLLAARLYACEIRRAHLLISVVGPIIEDVRERIGAELEANEEEFKWIPGGIVLSIPVERAATALELLKEPFNLFVDMAMARVRRAVGMDDHSPEAVDYVSAIVGRRLPQPIPRLEPIADGGDEDDDGEEVSREPHVRGRAPIFEHGQRSIASLLSDIERGVIALPDLQRPFVWEDTKVRDLLDSLFLGFPVGTLVFWHTSSERDARGLGADRPELRAQTLVIDGQQRLTSLFAVMNGVQIIGRDGDARRINIAFRPRDGRFEVTDAAIRKDPEFIPDVTDLWSGSRTKQQIRRELLSALREKARVVDERYEDAVERNIERAHSISEYRFPTVDIRKTASTQAEEATEEDVAEIFVRINNQGTRLGQADFVLTLLSVFHGKLRDRIEERAKVMSEGGVVTVDTQQLLRAICGVAFGRARMSAVYRFLRGVDPNTGEADVDERKRRLDQLDEAADICLDLTSWRDYLLRVNHAGFVSPGLIASKNAIVNAYAFYIRGRKFGVPRRDLEELISRWLYVSLLTARYSGSSETVFEQDLARVNSLRGDGAMSFVDALDSAMYESVGGDYWARTLVSTLETQKARAPSALGFRAAQVVLGAKALFSDQLLQNVLAPGLSANRSASELHHLFPEAWLRSRGITERRQINQVANLADTGWYDNSVIGSRGPAQYVPRLRDRLRIDDERWARMCAEHALPIGWERLEYDEFLHERRKRMAEIAHSAFRQLGGASNESVAPPWFLPGTEEVWKRITETEVALRQLVRESYTKLYGGNAAAKIEATLGGRERTSLYQALRSRPAGADPLSNVDYLYLQALPALLFSPEMWQEIRQRTGADKDAKGRLNTLIQQIVKVRNEIAHVREVQRDELMRASVACGDVIKLIEPLP
jgi:hypothetical protein